MGAETREVAVRHGDAGGGLDKAPAGGAPVRRVVVRRRAGTVAGARPLWPLVVFLLYVFGTMMLAIWGPWQHPDGVHWAKTALYVMSALGFFALGYLSRRRLPRQSRPRPTLWKSARVAFLLGLGIALGLAVVMLATRASSADSSAIERLANPGKTYEAAQEVALFGVSPVSRLGQFTVIAAPLSWTAIPIALYATRHARWRFRLLALAAAVLPVLAALIAVGTFKRTGDFALISAAVVALWAAGGKISRRTAAVGLAVGVFAVGAYFTYHLYSRFAHSAILETFDSLPDGQRLDRSHLLLRPFSPGLRTGVAGVMSYASQGYYGLSKALDQPFVWTRGAGHSLALAGYADQYLQTGNLINLTYPVRAADATGSGGLSMWHTIFPWLASDLTFLGTLPLMFLLGRWYVTVLLEALIHENPLSIAVFSYLTILLAFVPCNNQLFQARDSAVAMYGLSLAWLLFHRRFNHRQAMEMLWAPRAAGRSGRRQSSFPNPVEGSPGWRTS